jgi:hypothetical protein
LISAAAAAEGAAADGAEGGEGDECVGVGCSPASARGVGSLTCSQKSASSAASSTLLSASAAAGAPPARAALPLSRRDRRAMRTARRLHGERGE